MFISYPHDMFIIAPQQFCNTTSLSWSQTNRPASTGGPSSSPGTGKRNLVTAQCFRVSPKPHFSLHFNGLRESVTKLAIGGMRRYDPPMRQGVPGKAEEHLVGG